MCQADEIQTKQLSKEKFISLNICIVKEKVLEIKTLNLQPKQ